MRELRIALAALISISLIGCSTMRAVERPTSTRHDQIAQADQVRITTKAGKAYSLKVVEVAGTAMIGRDEAGKLWKVPYEQIESIETKRTSGWKTAGATVAVVIATLAVLIVVALRNLDDEINDEIHDNFTPE